jgi:hypothetical protein
LQNKRGPAGPGTLKPSKKVLQERLLNEMNEQTEAEEESENEYEATRMTNIAANNLMLEQLGIGEQV